MTETAALRYQTIYNRLRIAAGQQIAALWLKVGGLDDQAAERFTRLAVAQMNGATAAVARLNLAYLLTSARTAGVNVGNVDINLRSVTGKALRGVDPADVYLRPIVTARAAIANGRTFDEAMQLGRDRAVNLAETDIALTQRATTTAVLPRTKAVGYRRTLTGASCTLCATASTQRYHSAQLMPLHSHCDCGVAPIFGTSDPGRVINTRLLDELKTSGKAGELAHNQAIANATKTVESSTARLTAIDKQLANEKPGSRRDQLETQRNDLLARKTTAENKIVERRQTLADFRKHHTFSDTVTVHQHGELGPVLTRAGDHFTTEVEALH